MTNPFSSPAAPGAPDPAPRPRDLVGCLVAYSPREFTPAGAPGNTEGYDGGEPRDRVTADLILLETANGAPIAFGGFPEVDAKPRPHHLSVAAPTKFDGVWISNSTIVTALAPAKQALVGQLILGRVQRSDFGRKPFNLVSVDGTPDMAKAVDIYTRLSMGALQYVTPQPIPGVPVPDKGQSVAASAAPMPPANSVNYGYAPSPVPPQPTAWATPPAPPAPVPAAPAMDFAAFQAQQQAAAAQAALAAAGMQPTPIAPPNGAVLEPQLLAQGWTTETWSQLNQDQKSQVRVAAGLPPF